MCVERVTEGLSSWKLFVIFLKIFQKGYISTNQRHVFNFKNMESFLGNFLKI